MYTPAPSYLRISKFVFSLTLASLLAAGSASAAGCDGLGNNGDYAKKIKERQGNGGQKTMGFDKAAALNTERKKIQKKLESCQSKVGNSLSIHSFNEVTDRLGSALKTYDRYIRSSQAICQKYEKSTSEIDAQAQTIAHAEVTNQKDYFKRQNNLNDNAADRYKDLQKDAANSGRGVEEGLPGNTPDSDPRMNSAIKNFSSNLKNQVSNLEGQARKKLGDRADTADGEVVVAKMRFKTKADVQKFYQGTDECKAALQDLEKFGEKYKKLSKDLAEAKGEAKDAMTAFNTNQNRYERDAAAIKARATDLGDDSVQPTDGGLEANSGRKAPALNPTDGGPEANAGTAPKAAAVNDKTQAPTVAYSDSNKASLISQGQDPRRTAIGGSLLGTFTKDGQVYEVMGAKSYNGNTPMYARPKK